MQRPVQLPVQLRCRSRSRRRARGRAGPSHVASCANPEPSGRAEQPSAEQPSAERPPPSMAPPPPTPSVRPLPAAGPRSRAQRPRARSVPAPPGLRRPTAASASRCLEGASALPRVRPGGPHSPRIFSPRSGAAAAGAAPGGCCGAAPVLLALLRLPAAAREKECQGAFCSWIMRILAFAENVVMPLMLVCCGTASVRSRCFFSCVVISPPVAPVLSSHMNPVPLIIFYLYLDP